MSYLETLSAEQFDRLDSLMTYVLHASWQKDESRVIIGYADRIYQPESRFKQTAYLVSVIIFNDTDENRYPFVCISAIMLYHVSQSAFLVYDYRYNDMTLLEMAIQDVDRIAPMEHMAEEVMEMKVELSNVCYENLMEILGMSKKTEPIYKYDDSGNILFAINRIQTELLSIPADFELDVASQNYVMSLFDYYKLKPPTLPKNWSWRWLVPSGHPSGNPVKRFAILYHDQYGVDLGTDFLSALASAWSRLVRSNLSADSERLYSFDISNRFDMDIRQFFCQNDPLFVGEGAGLDAVKRNGGLVFRLYRPRAQSLFNKTAPEDQPYEYHKLYDHGVAKLWIVPNQPKPGMILTFGGTGFKKADTTLVRFLSNIVGLPYRKVDLTVNGVKNLPDTEPYNSITFIGSSFAIAPASDIANLDDDGSTHIDLTWEY